MVLLSESCACWMLMLRWVVPLAWAMHSAQASTEVQEGSASEEPCLTAAGSPQPARHDPSRHQHVAAAAALQAQVQRFAKRSWLWNHTQHKGAKAGWHCAVYHTRILPVPECRPAEVWTFVAGGEVRLLGQPAGCSRELTIDHTAAVRVNARWAVCQVAGSGNLPRNQLCSFGGYKGRSLVISGLRGMVCRACPFAGM